MCIVCIRCVACCRSEYKESGVCVLCVLGVWLVIGQSTRSVCVLCVLGVWLAVGQSTMSVCVVCIRCVACCRSEYNESGGGEAGDMQLKPLKGEENVKVVSKSYEPSLGKAIARAYGMTFLKGSAFKLIHDSLMFISPMLLK